MPDVRIDIDDALVSAALKLLNVLGQFHVGDGHYFSAAEYDAIEEALLKIACHGEYRPKTKQLLYIFDMYKQLNEQVCDSGEIGVTKASHAVAAIHGVTYTSVLRAWNKWNENFKRAADVKSKKETDELLRTAFKPISHE